MPARGRGTKRRTGRAAGPAGGSAPAGPAGSRPLEAVVHCRDHGASPAVGAVSIHRGRRVPPHPERVSRSAVLRGILPVGHSPTTGGEDVREYFRPCGVAREGTRLVCGSITHPATSPEG